MLIVAHPSVGHMTALLNVGERLREAGADVRFATTTMQLPAIPLPSMLTTAMAMPKKIEAAGLRFVPLRPALPMLAYGALMPMTSGASEMRLAGRMMSAGIPSLVRQLEAELDASPADVIIADFAFLAAWLTAERRSIPFIAFFHAGLPFPIAGHYPYTAGEQLARTIDARVEVLRRKLGLPPITARVFDAPYSQDLNFLATTPALEGRTGDYPRTHWLGPCIDGRSETRDFPFDQLQAEATKVYVSLGTVFNSHPDRFRALISGLSQPGVQLVVSAGASHDALQPLASPSVLILRWVPQLAVLAAVDYVVSHGGNNTVNETLAAGRPLLVLPIGGEQEANARRVERIAAGIALDRNNLTPAAVREAFARLRADEMYKVNASTIKKSMTGLAGSAEAARLTLALVDERRHG